MPSRPRSNAAPGRRGAQGTPAGVIGRYSGLKSSANGSYITVTLCKEYDELLAIYK
jgi:hypothetical protein